MDGCVRLGAVLPPLFIRGEASDAACDRSRRAGQWGQRAAAAKGRILRKTEGGGGGAGPLSCGSSPLHFSLRPFLFFETLYPRTRVLSFPTHPAAACLPRDRRITQMLKYPQPLVLAAH